MDDAIVQAYGLARAVVLGVVAVLALLTVLLERRARRLAPAFSIVRALIALAGFVGMLAFSGAGINWLWGAVAAVAGAVLGHVSGRASQTEAGGRGSITIRRSPVPMLLLALGYVLAVFTLLYGTTGLFSVAMLVVLLGTAAVIAASGAEMAASGGADGSKSAEPA